MGRGKKKINLSNTSFPVAATSRHNEVPQFPLHLLLTSALLHCHSGEEAEKKNGAVKQTVAGVKPAR